jgi:hypothetical protein
MRLSHFIELIALTKENRIFCYYYRTNGKFDLESNST